MPRYRDTRKSDDDYRNHWFVKYMTFKPLFSLPRNPRKQKKSPSEQQALPGFDISHLIKEDNDASTDASQG